VEENCLRSCRIIKENITTFTENIKYSGTIPKEAAALIADAYREAFLAQADMRSATEALENIRNSTLTKNPFTVWDEMDRQIGLAENNHFRPVLITLRDRFEEMLYSKVSNYADEHLKLASGKAWITWLQTYVEALSLWRLKYCYLLSKKKFDFPVEANATVEKIRTYTPLLLKQRWAEAFHLYEYLAERKELSEIHRAKTFVIAAQTQLFDLLNPHKAKELLDRAKEIAPNDVTVICGYGDYLLETGMIEQAINQFELAAKKDDTLVYAYVGLGRCYENKDDLVNAEEYYQDAISKAPGWTAGYVSLCKLYGRPEFFKLYEERMLSLVDIAIAVGPEGKYTRFLEVGEIYRQNYQYEKAHEWFQKAIELDPNHFGAFISKGYAYIEQSLYDKAREEFKNALVKAPEAFDGYWGMSWCCENEGKLEESLHWYEESLKLRPQWEAMILTKMAEIELNLNRLESAYERINKVVKLEPNLKTKEILQDLALRYYNEGNKYIQSSDDNLTKPTYNKAIECYNKAIECYDRILELEPKESSILNSKGIILYVMKRYEESLLYYNKAIEVEQSNYDAWFNKGSSLSSLKRYNEALESYDKALEINPNDAYAWAGRGNVMLELQRYNEALESNDKALEINLRDSYVWTKRGISLRRLKRYNEALESYDKALEINPNDAYALNCKAYLLALMNRNEEGYPLVKRSLQIDPFSAKAFHTKGFILYNLKRYNEALESYDKAISLDPNHSPAWEGKATCLHLLKRDNEALESYDKAISLEPDDSNLRSKRKLVVDEMVKHGS
jgi:tetratricopeptide (TPR) repeat protein